MANPAVEHPRRTRAASATVRLPLAAGVALGLLAGCADVRTISPNDPEYYYTGAPSTWAKRYAPGERPYRPLGGDRDGNG